MSLLRPWLTPLTSLGFALGGAALALAWFATHPALSVLIVLAGLVVTAVIQQFALLAIRTRPLRALALLEFRVFGIAIASAGLSALVIIVTVAFTLPDPQESALDTSTRQVIAAVGAALTAFISAIAISGDKVEDEVAALVEDRFRDNFTGNAADTRGRVVIDRAVKGGQRAIHALNSTTDYGWSDWSRKHRRARVEAIAAYLAAAARGEYENVATR